MTDFFSPLARMREQLRDEARRFQGLIFRGIVRLVDDSVVAQVLQVEFPGDDVADEVEHAQPFGVSFRPPTGDDVEALVIHVGGDHDHPIAVCVADRTNRPAADVQPGEGGLYLEGAYRVFLAADGIVHLGEQDAAEFLARADRVDERLRQLEDAFLDHVHPPITTSAGPQPVLGPGVPPAAALTYVLNRNPTAADTVKGT